MSKEKNGGPAFPVTDSNGPFGSGDDVTIGMSLRDYFAAHASDGDIYEIMNAPGNYEIECNNGITQKCVYKITRQQARYIHADGMIIAREK